MGEFYRTRDVKASRKLRTCEECGTLIAVGEPYRAYSQVCEGQFDSGALHADCQRWANAVMNSDDGRGFLHDTDPTDEYELAEAVLANRPPAAVYARLPPSWRAAVDDILKGADPVSGQLL